MSTPSLLEVRVAAALRGENPTVIGRMRSGYLVMADRQTPRGWCILIAVPLVFDLDEMAHDVRTQFLADMAAAGAAIKAVTGAYRMNYSVLGNTDPFVHAHLQPRFADEPDALRRQPIWAIAQQLDSIPFDADRDRPWMRGIAEALRVGGHLLTDAAT